MYSFNVTTVEVIIDSPEAEHKVCTWISEEGEISEVKGEKAQDNSMWFLLKGSKKRLAYLGIAGLIREGGGGGGQNLAKVLL